MMYQPPQYFPQYDASQQQYAAPAVITVQPTMQQMQPMQPMPTMTVVPQPAPHDMSQMVQMPQQDYQLNDPSASQAGSGLYYKTRMCIKWSEGYCQFGDKCRFAHGEHELRTVDDQNPQGFDPSGMHDQQGDEKQKVVRELMKKTKLCEHYKKGSCPYGDRCFFAHGDVELREAPDMGGKLARGTGALTNSATTPSTTNRTTTAPPARSKGLKRALDAFEPTGAIAAEIEKVQADLAIAEGEYAAAQKTVADVKDRLSGMPETTVAYALLEPRKAEAVGRQKVETLRARVDELKYMAMWTATKKSRPASTAGDTSEFCESEAHIDMWANMTLRYSASLTWLRGVRDRLNKYIDDIENHVVADAE